MELERLAEELVTRESNNAGTRFSGDGHDLPIYVPLSHDNPYLSASTFNVEEFLLSRSYTSLPDLRSELRDYLITLKEELVKLINDDYEAFISLSTDLRGEGARLERLKWPLGGLRAQVLVCDPSCLAKMCTVNAIHEYRNPVGTCSVFRTQFSRNCRSVLS
jgi:conserved oligomeric Golgi complex subunit 2